MPLPKLNVLLPVFMFFANATFAQTDPVAPAWPQHTQTAQVPVASVADQFPASPFGADTAFDRDYEIGGIIEKTKNYSKVFRTGSAADELIIDNTFGRISVNTWNRAEFKVDIEIKVYAANENDAQNFLDAINVNSTRSAASADFKTTFGDGPNPEQLLWKADYKQHIRKIEVNYIVYMPALNPLSIVNRYGSTTLPDMGGRVNVHSFYGSLQAKKLLNRLNRITVSHGDTRIDKLIGSNLVVSFGKLNLADGDNLNASIQYCPAHIGVLRTAGNIKVKYGDTLRIAGLDKNLKKLDITSSYTNLKMGVNQNENADLDIITQYGNIDYGRHTSSYKARLDSSRTTTVGKLGKGSKEKLITIRSNFGNVLFE